MIGHEPRLAGEGQRDLEPAFNKKRSGMDWTVVREAVMAPAKVRMTMRRRNECDLVDMVSIDRSKTGSFERQVLDKTELIHNFGTLANAANLL
ncbi:hypothetical protein R6Q59_020274 [Mikania micrantha]